jgi:hypothetical protein
MVIFAHEDAIARSRTLTELRQWTVSNPFELIHRDVQEQMASLRGLMQLFHHALVNVFRKYRGH